MAEDRVKDSVRVRAGMVCKTNVGHQILILRVGKKIQVLCNDQVKEFDRSELAAVIVRVGIGRPLSMPVPEWATIQWVES